MANNTKGETKQVTFKYTDLAALMVKDAGIHEGFWSLYVRFGINAANLGINNASPVPTAIVPIIELGITREDEQGPLAIDASKVNPITKSRGRGKAARSRKK